MLQRTVLVQSRNSTRRKKKLHKSPLERTLMSTQSQLVGTQYFWCFLQLSGSRYPALQFGLMKSWNGTDPDHLTPAASQALKVRSVSDWTDVCTVDCFKTLQKSWKGGIKVYFPVGMKNYLSEAETCSQKGEIPQTVHPAYFHQKVKHLTTMFLVQNKQDIFIKVSL